MVDKETRKYKCDWPSGFGGICGEEFERKIGKITGRKGCSDQVICPRCGNFLKT